MAGVIDFLSKISCLHLLHGTNGSNKSEVDPADDALLLFGSEIEVAQRGGLRFGLDSIGLGIANLVDLGLLA